MGIGKFIKDFGKGFVNGIQGANWVDRWSTMRLDLVYQEIQQVFHEAVVEDKPELLLIIGSGLYEAWIEAATKQEQDHYNEIVWLFKYEASRYNS